jgi:hypothetical protein
VSKILDALAGSPRTLIELEHTTTIRRGKGNNTVRSQMLARCQTGARSLAANKAVVVGQSAG